MNQIIVVANFINNSSKFMKFIAIEYGFIDYNMISLTHTLDINCSFGINSIVRVLLYFGKDITINARDKSTTFDIDEKHND